MYAVGTVLTAAIGGGSGHKPRPAVVVQADDVEFPETLVIIPLTSRGGADIDIKPVFHPDQTNGLLEPSSLMTHRITAIRKSGIGSVIGGMSRSEMERVDAALKLVLGLDRA